MTTTDQHVMRFGEIPTFADIAKLGPLSSPDEKNADQFLNKAKQLVMEAIIINAGGTIATRPEIYIVWFCKTLQHWKALLSTDIPDGRYYEVTYNGDKKEAYVDTYIKASNHVIPDSSTLTTNEEE